MSDRPVLRVVAGGMPSDEEVAALTAVLSALQSRRAATGAGAGRDAAWGRAGWLAAARRASLRQPR